MFTANGKMSQEASDVLTDGDCEELVSLDKAKSLDLLHLLLSFETFLACTLML